MTFTSSTISAAQTIGTIQGGTVIGVQNVVSAPQCEPPSPQQVIAYLTAITAPGREETDPTLQRFFQAEFRVFGQPPPELAEALTQIWTTPQPGQNPLDIVLLADSGSGKTLALRKLSKRLADQSKPSWEELAAAQGDKSAPVAAGQPWPLEQRIPLLLNLADLHAGLSLLSLARIAFNGVARTQVQDGQIELLLPACIVFLDGLDEMPPGGSPERVGLFMQEHTETRFVVTTRPTADFQQLGAVHVLRLLDLDDQQVEEIMGLERWGPVNQSVRQLARNRSLLKMILTWQDAQGISNKGQLVRAWIADKMRAVEDDADREVMTGILERLALAMQREQTYRAGDRKVMEVVDAYLRDWHEDRPWRAVASLLRAEPPGLLTRGNDGLWSFRDRLTQAYFVAAAITHDPTLLPVAVEQVSNPWWFESWEMLAGLDADPLARLFDLIDRDPAAAARCLVFSGLPLTTNLADALFDALRERRGFGRWADRARIVECLGWFDHPQTRQALLDAVLEDPYSAVVLMGVRQCCRFVEQETTPLSTVEEIRKRLREPKIETAMTGLFDLWRRYAAHPDERPDIERQLISLMRRTRGKKQLSGVAAIMLGFIGSDRSRNALLVEFMKPDLKEFHAWCVTDALGQQPHEATRQIALEVFDGAAYQGDEQVQQRARAIYLLGWMQPSPDARDAVTRALSNPRPEVRRRAAQSLGRWQANWSRELLEEQLRREQDQKVIDKIVQALGPVGLLETLPLLESSLRRALRAATRRHIRNAMETIRLRHAM
jgi:HEAT repeat protein